MSADFVVLIPARLESSRLPEKPLLDLGGKPMVVRCAEIGRLSGATRVVVATDSPRIREVVEAHGHEALMTRPDHSTGTDRLAEAADRLKLADDALVVNLQGDEPLMDPRLLEALAERLQAAKDAMMATVVHPLHALDAFLSPDVVKVVLDQRGDALWFSRSPMPWPRDAMRQAPDAWPLDFLALRHVGLYAYRRAFLREFTRLAPSPQEKAEALEQLRALYHGYRIAALRVEEAPLGGVDTAEDLARVRLQIDRMEKVR